MGAAGSALVDRHGPSIDGAHQGRFLGFGIALQGSDGVLRQLRFGGVQTQHHNSRTQGIVARDRIGNIAPGLPAFLRLLFQR